MAPGFSAYAKVSKARAWIDQTTDGSGSGSCFAKESTRACRMLRSTAPEEAYAACYGVGTRHHAELVLLADLAPGDLILGRNGATTVVAVQHKAVDTIAKMLTFHTADGSSVTMTPDHALFVDGQLVAAVDVKMGSSLSSGVVERIVETEAAIINAVTSDGTIVADGILAASNPLWIARLTLDAPSARAVVNAALFAAGDVDSLAAGFAVVLGWLVATLVAARLAMKVAKLHSASK